MYFIDPPWLLEINDLCMYNYLHDYLLRAHMGQATCRYCGASPGWLAVCLCGMFVWEICLGVYGESSQLILIQILLLLTVLV